jgi:hypothetical protein
VIFLPAIQIMETLLTGLMRLPLLGKFFRSGLLALQRKTANAMKRVARNEIRPARLVECRAAQICTPV